MVWIKENVCICLIGLGKLVSDSMISSSMFVFKDSRMVVVKGLMFCGMVGVVISFSEGRKISVS